MKPPVLLLFAFSCTCTQPCFFSLGLISFLSATHQTSAQTDKGRQSLIQCAVNCIRLPDCSHFTFNGTAFVCYYGSSTDLQTNASLDKSNSVPRWNKFLIDSQTSQNEYSFVFKRSSELNKVEPCPPPEQIPDAFVKYYQQYPSWFDSMNCALTSPGTNSDSIICFNNGSWSSINDRCYEEVWDCPSSLIKLNFGSQRLKVGSVIYFSGPMTNRQTCELHLITGNEDTVFQLTLSMFSETSQTRYTCSQGQNGKWQQQRQGVVTSSRSYLNVTITVLETNYKIRLYSQTTQACNHALRFQSVQQLELGSQEPFDEVKIIF